MSFILSKTLLRGLPSSFTLELPPYRKPQIAKVVVRSIFDRTLFVLSRAVLVALPAGALIFCMANVAVGGQTLLTHCAAFLDPFARFIGLDGFILLAFLLGIPANEIVMPIVIMCYLNAGQILEMSNLSSLHALLLSNDWTMLTACCFILFSLLHFPCATTLLTIKRETGSLFWTALAFLIPTAMGILLCAGLRLLFG